MAVDAPAKIAIIGAGPIGLEAALYARFLGYHVDLFESGQIADNIRRWGHVRMFSPFRMNGSRLALAAIRAQDESYQPPGDDEVLTGDEWIERFLLPLAQTDLLSDHIHQRTKVIAVGRPELLKTDFPSTEARSEDDFRLLTCSPSGQEQTWDADVVIDCSGVFATPNWMGRGGLPAVGETARRARIEYGPPDILGRARERYQSKRTLVVGGGYSAATSIVALAQLAKSAPETRIVWALKDEAHDGAFPLSRIADDSLPERDALAVAANALGESAAVVERLDGARVDAIEDRGAGFLVRFAGVEPREIECDEIIANVGYRGDGRIFEELQVHQCYATGGPMKLASTLLKNPSEDCLSQPVTGAEALLTTEPHFYLLGAKSFGRNPRFLFRNGLEQIRQLFTIIGDRADLDLYDGAGNLPT